MSAHTTVSVTREDALLYFAQKAGLSNDTLEMILDKDGQDALYNFLIVNQYESEQDKMHADAVLRIIQPSK